MKVVQLFGFECEPTLGWMGKEIIENHESGSYLLIPFYLPVWRFFVTEQA